MDLNNLSSDGHPVPLIVFRDKKFILDSEGERILKQEQNKSIGIIALVGKYRTGKSFLLNRVLLNKKDHGFGVGPTIKPCTKGIWMWSKPIIVENNHNSEKFPVYVIDTEGLGAYDEEQNHDTKIFLISILISSLFILNSFGVIDETAITTLSFVINLSKIIKLSNNPKENTEFNKYFPSLFWVLRDFSLKLEDSEGNTITAKQYLENALKQQTGNSDQIDEKNKLKSLICNYFTERDCFTLVRPVENESDLQNLQSIEESLFRKEFLEQSSLFRNKVYKKVKPKVLNGRFMNGEMMINLMNSVLESINNGGIPVLENSWKYVCQNECIKLSNEVINEFKIAIRKFKEENKENLKFFSEFETFQKNLVQQSIEKFKANAIGNEQVEFEEKLRNNFNNEIKRFNEENCRFYEKTLNDILEKNNKIIIENLEKDKYSKNYYDFFQDLEVLKENTECSTPDFPLKKEILFSKMINIIKRFIEITFVKNKLQNEKEILHLKNDLTLLNNKFKVKSDELESIKTDLHNQIEKLTLINNELKNKDTSNSEAVRKAEVEKKSLQIKADKDTFALKKEYDVKIEKLKTEITRLEHESKQKEEQISNLNFSNDKQCLLYTQKIEFLETDINNLKLRAEQIKHENDVLRSQNNDLETKIDSFKEEQTKKKILEFEIEKIKKQRDYLQNAKKNELDSTTSALRNQLEITRKQLEESNKKNEELLIEIRKNTNIPDSLSKLQPKDDNPSIVSSNSIFMENQNINPPESSKQTSISNNPPPQSQVSSQSINNTPQSNITSNPRIKNNFLGKDKRKINSPENQADEVILIGSGDYMTPEEMNIGGPETVVYEKEILKCAGAGQDNNQIKSPIINVPQKPSRLNKGKASIINETTKEDKGEIDNNKEPQSKGDRAGFLEEDIEQSTSNILSGVFKKTQIEENIYQASPSLNVNENKDQTFFNNNSNNIYSNTNNLGNTGGIYQELLESNKILTQSLSKYESRCQQLEDKINKLKNIKEIIKQSGGLQCKHCMKFFSFEEYEEHVDECNTENSIEYHKSNEKIQIKIIKGVLKRDDMGRPFIEYIVDIFFNHHNWKVNRKFIHFSNLHKQLKESFPDIHLPHSSKLFSKISDSSNNFHENKINLLENYLKDISEIYEVKTSKIFRNFFGLDDYTDHSDFEKMNILTEKSSIMSKSNNKQVEVMNIYKEKNQESIFNEEEQRSQFAKLGELNYFKQLKSEIANKLKENKYSDSKIYKNITFSQNI